MSLLVIIVNYRTPQHTVACLESLRPQAEALALRVVVVENGSADDSARHIGDAIADRGWSDWCRMIVRSDNRGFGSGNNAALREGLSGADVPRFFMLLNPDTIVTDGSLQTLTKFLDDHPEVGIVGGCLEHEDGTPQHTARRFPTVLGELETTVRLGVISRLLSRWAVAPPPSPKPHRTHWVPGACMMIRREVLEKVGLFDEKFFLYFEEVDLCRRAGNAGWSCWYVPDSRVIHFVGQATGISDLRKKAPRRPAYWFQSRRRYHLKHLGRLRAVAADLAWMAGHVLWRMRRRVQGKPDLDPPKFLSDFFRHSVLRTGFHLEAASAGAP